MPQDWFEQFVTRSAADEAASGQARLMPSHASSARPAATASDWFDRFAEKTAAPATKAATEDDGARTFLSSLSDLASGFWKEVNPVTAAKSAVAAAGDLKGAAKGALDAQGQVGLKAWRAFHDGDYVQGVRHALNYMLPVIGPTSDRIGDTLQEGRIAEGIGETAGMATMLGLPSAASAAKNGLRLPAIARNPNAAERAAVEFGMREGVPIDAATATGNRAVKAIQHVADRSLGGSAVAERATQRQAQALARTGERLAERGYPTSAVTPEQAGQSVREALRTKVVAFNEDATAAYDSLRAIEADPRFARQVQVGKDASGKPVMETLTLPVDLRGVKDALNPIYQRLLRESQLVPLHGDKARALTALDRLVTGFDAAPLSVVDAALGDLKSMARADIPELRSVGQGLAAGAVKRLDAVVRQTAADAGPDAVRALEAGREATKAKYWVGDLLEDLVDEPVKVFNSATAAKDAGIKQLRQIAEVAPDVMPQVGRAYLDDLFEKATAEGGFSKAQGLQASWQKLGPETKKVLFHDPAYINDLNNFFLLAKKATETPNPSGTAHTLITAGQGGWILTEPISGITSQIGMAALSKLLHSPTGARLLTKSLRVPVGNRAAAAAVSADLAKFAGDRWWMAAPAAAEDQDLPPGARVR